ncbi:preprotein translocase subunit SecD family protein [Lacunimicrobium album]
MRLTLQSCLLLIITTSSHLLAQEKPNSNTEFAIVANSIDHKSIFEAAEKTKDDPSTTEVKIDGTTRARWVPIAVDSRRQPKLAANGSDMLIRQTEVAGKKRSEVLLLVDAAEPETINGKHLSSVKKSFDSNGGTAIAVELDPPGGRTMELLTTRYRPTKTGRRRQLAIVLNGEVHSAPSLNDVISNSLMITGLFTEEEVDELVNSLSR